MQEEKLRLRGLRVGALPILNRFIERMGLEEELTLALKNPGYADALLALIKNILVERNALYAVGEWVALYDVGLVAQGKIGDDKLGRANRDPLLGMVLSEDLIDPLSNRSLGLGPSHALEIKRLQPLSRFARCDHAHRASSSGSIGTSGG
jgi:hypothetical protein